MTRRIERPIVLAAASGLLMGLAYPPSPLGPLATVAWVPLLFLVERCDGYFKTLRWTYGSMFLFQLLTLYWAGGFVHGRDLYMMLAGALLLVAHPLAFSMPFLAWKFIREHAGRTASWAAFPFLWVGFEYLHSVNEFSFPWLLLGNTQTYDLAMLQMVSVTGVFGLSLLIASANMAVYAMLEGVRAGRWRMLSLPAAALGLFFVGLQAVPRIFGTLELAVQQEPPDPERQVRLGVIQPDIDPFEKWAGNEEAQMDVLLGLTGSLADSAVELVIWPETATPFYLLHPGNRAELARIRAVADSMCVSILTGVPDIVYYDAGSEAPPGSKLSSDGRRYDSYNGAVLIAPGDAPLQKYAKIILVPFAEHVPYSEHLSALNVAQWNFGLGGWSIGRDSTIFRLERRTPEGRFASFICYESVFPGYVAGFVRNGAQFLAVVTNDSWWGNTSGAYQHMRYAIVRAVENRRWVVQCANGGISAIIDPWGRVAASAPLYTRGILTGSVLLSDELTFYTRHGDWLAQSSLLLAACALGGAIIRRTVTARRRR